MADSDEEHDRRRREKFRRERSDYQDRREVDDRSRKDWSSNSHDQWTRSRRDYYRSDRRYSPSPPAKRSRLDSYSWDERRYSSYESSTSSAYQTDPYTAAYSSGTYAQPRGATEVEGVPTQPPMLSFKAFLSQQDDCITDEEAIRKYNEYKMEFKRQQLNDFFINHKEEEWFKNKYHPEDSQARKEEQLSAIKKRLEVFMDLMDKGMMNPLTVDADQSDGLLKLLDSIVILLEGGSEEDLKILELTPEQQDAILEENKPYLLAEEQKKKDEPGSEENKENGDTSTEKAVQDPEKSPENKPERKSERKRSFSGDSNKSNSSSSDSDAEDEPQPPGMLKADKTSGDQEENGKKEIQETEGQEEEEKKEESKPQEDNDENKKEIKDEEATTEETTIKEEKPEERNKPRPLHKTASIFLRNLAPTITKQEVEAMCKRYSGFLRAAIADPQPERRWFRRGWVTFERHVNIKEICWNLNNIRLRDCELGAIVNRDLSRRIRTVNGLTSHKQVVRNDIKIAAKIVQNLDERYALWLPSEQEKEDPKYCMMSTNPLLKNITDYLIDEASAEEDELLGTTSENGEAEEKDGETIERDENLCQVLDKLILYLRIVHSVDYYNHSEYPHEDEMPNRCGIMHARGIPPSSKVTQSELADYIKSFYQKISSFFQPNNKVTVDEAKTLGLKDPQDEVEKFVEANTQELAKDKWLCPLSGKKFKGPEFVRKHIFNKHAEKIEEVKKEVDYFNNYLMDPKRPMLQEHPTTKTRPDGRPNDAYSAMRPSDPYSQYGSYGRSAYPGYGAAYPRDYGRDPYKQSRSYGRLPRSYAHGREIIGYQDLDAPDEVDIF